MLSMLPLHLAIMPVFLQLFIYSEEVQQQMNCTIMTCTEITKLSLFGKHNLVQWCLKQIHCKALFWLFA